MCFRDLRDEHVFVIIYAVVASYFAGVMIRLLLTLTPIVCVAAAVALSTLLDTYMEPSQPEESGTETHPAGIDNSKKTKKADLTGSQVGNSLARVASSTFNDVIAATKGKSSQYQGIWSTDTRLAVIFNAITMLVFFVFHCTWITSISYSSPSVVLASTDMDGTFQLIDDYREAYYWLRQNTPQDAVVMSWWDYGYQIAGMADRSTMVDNNTWNNSMFLLSLHVSPFNRLFPFS